MNTPQSMMIGWGSLLFAGGISYYYAKKEIDARRRAQQLSGERPTTKKNWYERLDDPIQPESTPIKRSANEPQSANSIPTPKTTETK
ncbi:hypothetical protein BOTBODRAFT_233115 [Botryobasidium botryosum FD-172 SS1]|uniref:Uncharacterized protein n=1 Tax=Botryobasidium botryosum (strain FD-172 SS1) TaxID=930990 RepID=A0A067M5R1_BOTB1|nr:hypothetical protein BOTBODRAFT_233115 [Botryobasidium botryosum FD-172 SS1]